MILFRLIKGIVTGVIVGGLLGYGMSAAGLGVPGPLVAYLGAAVTGVVVACVSGKPIWAGDARIEVGMKAAAGALLAPGLLWLVRTFVTMGLPFDPTALPGLESLAGPSPAIGAFAVTSLALVGAILGGFYEADNQPKNDKQQQAGGSTGKRIATVSGESNAAAAEELESEADDARRQRR